MAQQSAPEAGEKDPVLTTVARLVTAADGDTLYRDVHLRRAAELLAPLVTETHYEGAVTRRQQLARLLSQARAAVVRQDWAEVRDLGTRAAAVRESLDAEQGVLAVAESVYGAPIVMLDPLSPGLTSPSKRWSNASAARADLTATFAELAREDPEKRALYASRQGALAGLAVPNPVAHATTAAAASATGDVTQQALQALERGDATALQGLAERMLGRLPDGEPSATGAATTARARLTVPDTLGTPLPEACRARAAALGLEPLEATLASPAVAASITEFVERYAMGASPAVHERARAGVAHVMVAAEEVAIPADVAAVFAETISLLALHLYVNSAGVRYVPVPAPRETLLVETHAEGDEPITPLLRELGFQRRRGLARDEIEEHLWRHGARVLADHLSLDPLAFRLVCIPGDVFVRIGRDRGWGRREEWTHFDGYQVLSQGRLRALVGGNSRFGGVYDLCSISRDDARDNVVLRLAVVHRDRMGVRIA